MQVDYDNVVLKLDSLLNKMIAYEHFNIVMYKYGVYTKKEVSEWIGEAYWKWDERDWECIMETANKMWKELRAIGY